MQSPVIINIGYGRNLFVKSDPERARLLSCAQSVAHMHMIVFSRVRHGLSFERVHDTFSLHPTHSRCAPCMIGDAVLLALRIMRQYPKGTRFCIAAQDPLAAGVVGYILRLLTGAPLLVQEHGDIFSHDYWRTESRTNRFWYPIARYIIRRADRVRVVAARVAKHVAELGVPRSRIVVLPVATDVRHVLSHTATRDLRSEYKEHSPIILSVARFVPQKNLTLLVRAFARAREHMPHAHLILVGKGSDERVVREEIARCGVASCVTILPWTLDVLSLMKTADIYALSSNYEGWGRVLIEAMACGLPVVSTDVGCAGEICKDHVHGLVVPVGDEECFAHALAALFADTALRARAHDSGPRDVQQLFASEEAYRAKWAALHDVERV